MDKKVGRAFSYIGQLGITMIIPILLMGILGKILNNSIDSNIPFIVCIILGILAGFRNCYILLKEELAKQEKEDAKKREKEILDVKPGLTYNKDIDDIHEEEID